jgi:hypothetical protein
LLIKFKPQGALFHGDDDLTQRAFKGAIELINSRSINYNFVTLSYNISRSDSFKAQQYGKRKFKSFQLLIKVKTPAIKFSN